MAELVAQAPGFPLEVVPVRVAEEGVLVELAVGVVQQRAGRRITQLHHGAVALVGGEQGQRRGIVEVEGHRRGDVDAVVGDLVDLRIGVATEHDHAAEDALVVGQRPGDIHGQLPAIVAAVGGPYLALGIRRRALADQVDHAARGVLAVQHRARATEDFGALQAIGLGGGVVAVALHPQAVAQQAVAVVGGVEAANEEEVAGQAVTGGERRREDTRHITEDFSERLRSLVLHALAGHHRYGAWRLGQRRAGLGACGAVAHLIAGRLLIFRLTGHQGRLQLQRIPLARLGRLRRPGNSLAGRRSDQQRQGAYPELQLTAFHLPLPLH
ncbi:hypothetical protein D3C81_1265820 [compost metagenome]